MSVQPLRISNEIPLLFKPDRSKVTVTEKLMVLFEKKLGPSKINRVAVSDYWRSAARITVYSSLFVFSHLEDLFRGAPSRAESQALFRSLAIQILSASLTPWNKLDVPPELVAGYRCALAICQEKGIDEKSWEGKAVFHAVLIQSIETEAALLENLYPLRGILVESTALPSMQFWGRYVLVSTLRDLGFSRENQVTFSTAGWQCQKNEGAVPHEVWISILEKMPLQNLFKMMQVSRTFYLLGLVVIHQELRKRVPDPSFAQLLQSDHVRGISSIIPLLSDPSIQFSEETRADLFLSVSERGVSWKRAQEIGWDQHLLNASFRRQDPKKHLVLSNIRYEKAEFGQVVKMLQVLILKGFTWDKIQELGWREVFLEIFEWFSFTGKIRKSSSSDTIELVWTLAKLGFTVDNISDRHNRDEFKLLVVATDTFLALTEKSSTFNPDQVLQIMESLQSMRLTYDRFDPVMQLIQALFERAWALYEQFSPEQIHLFKAFAESTGFTLADNDPRRRFLDRT